ncbi:MAG TPA: hypothetical protein VE569_05620, partial [Acidimicrobiia bacterium]|nr:hypothetical protein [Acidimicrobiia bacterium]
AAVEVAVGWLVVTDDAEVVVQATVVVVEPPVADSQADTSKANVATSVATTGQRLMRSMMEMDTQEARGDSPDNLGNAPGSATGVLDTQGLLDPTEVFRPWPVFG